MIGPNKPKAVVNPSQVTPQNSGISSSVNKLNLSPSPQFTGDTTAAAASLLMLHELAAANRMIEKYEVVKDEGAPNTSSFKVTFPEATAV